MQAKVGPTCAPARGVSASPAEKRSISLGASYRADSLSHKAAEISEGGELQEQAFDIPHDSLDSIPERFALEQNPDGSFTIPD